MDNHVLLYAGAAVLLGLVSIPVSIPDKITNFRVYGLYDEPHFILVL